MINCPIKSNDLRRTGTITVLMAFLLPVLVIVSAFVINIAFLQLSRTELMVATDAAARAGGRAISNYQNIDDAMTAAQVTASLNSVNGIPLQLNEIENTGEIEFGDAEPGTDSDRFLFEKVARSKIYSGQSKAAAIRINGRMTNSSLSGPLQAFFPTFGFAYDEFDMNQSAVAMQVDRDIALILDRSGSMSWHPGFDWPWPISPWNSESLGAGYDAGILGYDWYWGYYYYRSGQNSTTYQSWLWEEYYGLGSAPKTPWEELVEAVGVFLDVLEDTDQDEQVSVASYASSASLDIRLRTDYAQVMAEINTLRPTGATAIGEGMQSGIPSLLDSYARPYAAKTLLVMTDGVHNRGIDPDVVANSIVANYDVTIHTITFGNGADQTAMQQVSDIGGGEHFHADNGDELQAIFEEIANNLPTIVTQ